MTSDDEHGAYLMALGELGEIEVVVTTLLPASLFVLGPRFDRVKTVLQTLDGLVNSYLVEESQRLDAERGEQDVEDEKLRADLERFHESGQTSMLPADPVPHDDL